MSCSKTFHACSMFLAASACLLSLLAPVSVAQVATATFHGIVTDTTGAVIPGTPATVTYQDQGTCAATTKATDPTGEFQFDFLRVGSYTLAIEAFGFKKYESSGLQLVSGQRVRQTYSLEVGAITEIVEVVGQTPLVDTVAAEQRETTDDSNYRLK